VNLIYLPGVRIHWAIMLSGGRPSRVTLKLSKTGTAWPSYGQFLVGAQAGCSDERGKFRDDPCPRIEGTAKDDFRGREEEGRRREGL
jgi:hypothetical protein